MVQAGRLAVVSTCLPVYKADSFIHINIYLYNIHIIDYIESVQVQVIKFKYFILYTCMVHDTSLIQTYKYISISIIVSVTEEGEKKKNRKNNNC